MQVDELNQQISCYEQELDAKNKQFQAKDNEVKNLKKENESIIIDSANKVESLMGKLRDMERKINMVS